MIIKAIKVKGGWTMRADNGEMPTEGRVSGTRREVYKDCEAMYGNATWQGMKVRAGYSIVIG